MIKNHEEIKILVESTVYECINRYYKKDLFIPTGISNRHVHLSRNHIEILFGIGYKLTILKPLSQTEQYAAKETVNLIGPKGVINQVRILGPERKQTQVEVMMSDTYKLGLKVPVRLSGELDNTPGIVISGPKGVIYLEYGVMIARRHVHMNIEDAKFYNIRDKDNVKIHIPGERELTFDEVLVRVDPSFQTEFHIDMDEANAAGVNQGDRVKVIRKSNL